MVRQRPTPWLQFVAFAAVLTATAALVIVEYVSVRRADLQARARLDATLDLQLLTIVDDIRRDMLEHADYIVHSISHARVRNRDVPGLTRVFSQASQRFPEVRDFYAVFFRRGAEDGPWQVWRFVRTADFAVGLVEDPHAGLFLHRAWSSVSNRNSDVTFPVFARTSPEPDPERQIFFHPVYDPDHLRQHGDQDRIGLLVFTAEIQSYPSLSYLRNLLAQQEGRSNELGALGHLAYRVDLDQGSAQSQTLVADGDSPGPFRERRIDARGQLFPNVRFRVALRDKLETEYTRESSRPILIFGFFAALVALIGILLTARAAVREVRVSRLKSQFLASVSHELKTPLTAVRAFGDLLHSGRVRDSERVQQYGEMICRESDRLTQLVNNILEVSRMERCGRRYKFAVGDLGAPVAATVEGFEEALREEHYTIALLLPKSPVYASFDMDALHQAMTNLLSNAVKYSGSARRIEVTLSRETVSAVIEIRDFGIGIEPKEQRRIFEPFHRTSQPEVQQASGTGLGLAIVREIVQAHGGEVHLKSALGAGAAFQIRLPLGAPTAAAPGTDAAASRANSCPTSS
jgi:signal transduction histidine kinase